MSHHGEHHEPHQMAPQFEARLTELATEAARLSMAVGNLDYQIRCLRAQSGAPELDEWHQDKENTKRHVIASLTQTFNEVISKVRAW